ncbi:TetR/AcrR family transcriptional regulator [Nocardioides sp.]|uniref:TetR/AcrR family transcriptional regulator n=1 Tax=Nocardioides sp. TaxID=35761 RepID=UPI002B26D43B|nr:TetR/AcrR family transcriptional regulator [Nocardioides sp.]
MAQDGRQARWDKHNQQRRLSILDAALEVIESQAPGAEFHVQQIAEKAGLNRTVVYRHFTDRADLDVAIRAHVIAQLQAELTPTVTLEGTLNEIILRIITTYVDWTVAHPALHFFAIQESQGPFQQGIDQIAAMLSDLLEVVIALLGAELDENETALVDPLAHGLVSAVIGSVRRWLAREVREPSAARLSQLLAMSVYNLLEGHARRLGVVLDPDVQLSELFAQVNAAGESA